MGQLAHLYMTTGKTIALTRRTFVGLAFLTHLNASLTVVVVVAVVF